MATEQNTPNDYVHSTATQAEVSGPTEQPAWPPTQAEYSAMIRQRDELVEALRECLAMVDTDAGPPNWDHIRALLAKVQS